MDRRARLLARSWERARQRVLQTEGFLEDALASALEVPEFWQRFAREMACDGHVPPEQPEVSTQETVDEGRADIILEWPSGYRLAVELKVGEPPSPAQIERYLRSGLDVLAIAKFPASIDVETPGQRRFFGLRTWSQVHDIDWEDAPLEVQQLHRLLETTDVVMTKVTRSALEGIHASWDTWAPMAAWCKKGIDAIQRIVSDGGFKCVQQDRARQHVKIDEEHHRLAWWTWPSPWCDDYFGIYAGLYVGWPDDPVLNPGLPDLVVALHGKPDSPRGTRLREDALWTNAAKRWSTRKTDGLRREFDPAPRNWEILRCRTSTLSLLDANDPGAAMVKWMEACAREWVEDGITLRLGEVAQVR
jgi:hypothetical protein